MTAEPMPTLTTEEATALDRCERAIAGGLRTFVEVGEALQQVRDRRLYRAAFATFDDYCQDRWALGRNYANKLANAAAVAREIAGMGTAVPAPVSERQIRELTPLRDDPERLSSAWRNAVDGAGGMQPTSQQVRSAVTSTTRRPTTDGQLRGAITDLRRAAERLERLIHEPTFDVAAIQPYRPDLIVVGSVIDVLVARRAAS